MWSNTPIMTCPTSASSVFFPSRALCSIRAPWRSPAVVVCRIPNCWTIWFSQSLQVVAEHGLIKSMTLHRHNAFEAPCQQALFERVTSKAGEGPSQKPVWLWHVYEERPSREVWRDVFGECPVILQSARQEGVQSAAGPDCRRSRSGSTCSKRT